MIPGILIEKAVKLLASQFKLDKILKYVEEPNDADERIDNLEVDLAQSIMVVQRLKKRVKELESNSHKPRDFVTCEKCKQKIKEKE